VRADLTQRRVRKSQHGADPYLMPFMTITAPGPFGTPDGSNNTVGYVSNTKVSANAGSRTNALNWPAAE